MKFMTERVELAVEEFGTTEKDEALYVVIPKGLKEGQVKRVRELGRLKEDVDARVSNAEVLRYVREWNFDDETGAPLPLMSTILPDGKTLLDLPDKKRQEAERVLAAIPAQFYGWVARKLVSRQTFTEKTEGF